MTGPVVHGHTLGHGLNVECDYVPGVISHCQIHLFIWLFRFLGVRLDGLDLNSRSIPE